MIRALLLASTYTRISKQLLRNIAREPSSYIVPLPPLPSSSLALISPRVLLLLAYTNSIYLTLLLPNSKRDIVVDTLVAPLLYLLPFPFPSL
jgi:hypothetical protein